MSRSLFRLSAFIMAALVAILAMSVSGVLAADPPQRASQPAAASVVVKGTVREPLRLTVADLAAMPNQQTVTVAFNGPNGVEDRVFTGPLLFDVLQRAQPKFNAAIKNDKLRHYVSVTAEFDNYRALVAWGEFDPRVEGKQILLAVTQNGASLAQEGPRLVVPGDKSGGRYVTGVSRVQLGKPGV